MGFETFIEVLSDSFLDSLKILPIIFIVYVLIELIEEKSSSSDKFKKLLGSKSAPLFGAVIGVIPQCGFSVVATKLYQGGYILLGTLIAVYFSTSDEALPILISQAITTPSLWIKIVLLLSIKVIYAVAVGFLINAVVRKKSLQKIDQIAIEEAGEDGCCHHDVTETRHGFFEFFTHPLTHSLKIFVYVFIINVLFGVFVSLIGEENIENFLSANVYLQPLVATLIGIIPNCASSVVITQTFASGVLSLGAAVSGLTINSGLGLAVLFKDKKNLGKTFLIVLLSFILSLILGYSVTFITAVIA